MFILVKFLDSDPYLECGSIWIQITNIVKNIGLMQDFTVPYARTKLNLDSIFEDVLSQVDWNSRCRNFGLPESRPPFSCLKAVDKTLQPGSELTHRLLQLAFTATSLFPV